MSLEAALDAIVASAPFERVLLSRDRPVLARADAGTDAVAAALSRALDAPVLLIAPGPH
jgi:hypothetical protein